jgi:hypothetical protein
MVLGARGWQRSSSWGLLLLAAMGGWLVWLSVVGRDLTLDRWEGGELGLVANKAW